MTSLSPQRPRHRRILTPILFALALVVAACGGDPIPIAVPASAGESASQAEGQAAAVPVSQAQSDLGAILVDSAGFSLYGFTEDVDGQSTCDGGCAGAWPPVVVPSATLPSDLDPAIFSVIQRADGTNQLKAGKWPLYLFAGDTAPGQTTGHLSGDVWFLATPDGTLIGVEAPAEAATPSAAEESTSPDPVAVAETPVPLVSVGSSALGDILVNNAGLTLYGFTNDVDGLPTCEGGCAEAWPPVLTEGGVLPADLDPAIFSIVERPDGTNQLKAGKWPLYLFAGDTVSGQTTGHLSGDVWFVANPTGGLIDAFAPDAEVDEAPVIDDAADDGYGSGAAQPAQADEPTQATAVPATPVPPTPVPATAVPATPVPPTPVPATPVPATPVPAQPTPTPDSYSSDY